MQVSYKSQVIFTETCISRVSALSIKPYGYATYRKFCVFPPIRKGMATELPDGIYLQIEALSLKGNLAVDRGQFKEAIKLFNEAFDLLPEPKQLWDAAVWLLAAIGEAQYFDEDFEAASNTLNAVLRYPTAESYPFIHLRLGQSKYELSEIEAAKAELLKAYLDAGEEIFSREDPKYLDCLRNGAIDQYIDT